MLCFVFYQLQWMVVGVWWVTLQWMIGGWFVDVSGFAQLAEELGLPTTLSEVGVVDGEFRPQWQMLKQESHPPSTCLIDFSH